MDYCFDTSGINRLHDDPASLEIVTELLATNRVLITTLNIIEAGMTESSERRKSLLTLQRQLCANDRPVRLPTEVLKQLRRAYVEGLPSVDIAIDESDKRFWWVLREPEKLDESNRQEAYAWKNSLEKSFSEAHQEARSLQVSDLFSHNPPKSLGRLLQFCCKNSRSFLSTASSLFESITGKLLEETEMRSLFRAIP